MSEILKGYAIVFNARSEDLGGFVERIAPSAVVRTLRSRDDVLALHSHATAQLLGRRKTGTLKLAADQRGLAVEIDPPATPTGREVGELVRRGDLDAMSFGFIVPEGGDEVTIEGEQIVRTVKEMILLEVSVVSGPAYPQTSIGMHGRERPTAIDVLRLRNELAMR